MDQALELGPDSERLRNDAKSEQSRKAALPFVNGQTDHVVCLTANADTFEAFVGAVAQVHGQAAVTRWVEDLIKPCKAAPPFDP